MTYRELSVEDPEENFIIVLLKTLPDLIGRRETLPNPTGKKTPPNPTGKKTLPNPTDKKRVIIMKIVGGSAVEISTLQEAAL